MKASKRTRTSFVGVLTEMPPQSSSVLETLPLLDGTLQSSRRSRKRQRQQRVDNVASPNNGSSTLMEKNNHSTTIGARSQRKTDATTDTTRDNAATDVTDGRMSYSGRLSTLETLSQEQRFETPFIRQPSTKRQGVEKLSSSSNRERRDDDRRLVVASPHRKRQATTTDQTDSSLVKSKSPDSRSSSVLDMLPYREQKRTSSANGSRKRQRGDNVLFLTDTLATIGDLPQQITSNNHYSRNHTPTTHDSSMLRTSTPRQLQSLRRSKRKMTHSVLLMTGDDTITATDHQLYSSPTLRQRKETSPQRKTSPRSKTRTSEPSARKLNSNDTGGMLSLLGNIHASTTSPRKGNRRLRSDATKHETTIGPKRSIMPITGPTKATEQLTIKSGRRASSQPLIGSSSSSLAEALGRKSPRRAATTPRRLIGTSLFELLGFEMPAKGTSHQHRPNRSEVSAESKRKVSCQQTKPSTSGSIATRKRKRSTSLEVSSTLLGSPLQRDSETTPSGDDHEMKQNGKMQELSCKSTLVKKKKVKGTNELVGTNKVLSDEKKGSLLPRTWREESPYNERPGDDLDGRKKRHRANEEQEVRKSVVSFATTPTAYNAISKKNRKNGILFRSPPLDGDAGDDDDDVSMHTSTTNCKSKATAVHTPGNKSVTRMTLHYNDNSVHSSGSIVRNKGVMKVRPGRQKQPRLKDPTPALGIPFDNSDPRKKQALPMKKTTNNQAIKVSAIKDTRPVSKADLMSKSKTQIRSPPYDNSKDVPSSTHSKNTKTGRPRKGQHASCLEHLLSPGVEGDLVFEGHVEPGKGEQLSRRTRQQHPLDNKVVANDDYDETLMMKMHLRETKEGAISNGQARKSLHMTLRPRDSVISDKNDVATQQLFDNEKMSDDGRDSPPLYRSRNHSSDDLSWNNAEVHSNDDDDSLAHPSYEKTLPLWHVEKSRRRRSRQQKVAAVMVPKPFMLPPYFYREGDYILKFQNDYLGRRPILPAVLRYGLRIAQAEARLATRSISQSLVNNGEMGESRLVQVRAVGHVQKILDNVRQRLLQETIPERYIKMEDVFFGKALEQVNQKRRREVEDNQKLIQKLQEQLTVLEGDQAQLITKRDDLENQLDTTKETTAKKNDSPVAAARLIHPLLLQQPLIKTTRPTITIAPSPGAVVPFNGGLSLYQEAPKGTLARFLRKSSLWSPYK